MTDISGQWVPATNFQANCTTGQKCGNSTTTMRTTFQLLADATWVEKVLIGTGNCTSDASIVDSLILVVESFGFFKVDLEGLDNDSFPDNFGPQSLPQTVPVPLPQTPEPEPEPLIAPSINPAPAVNPLPSSNPAPVINPVPEVNPAPSISPAQSDLSPAELNPAPYIIIKVPVPANTPLIPIPTGAGTIEPSPAPQISPQPSPVPVLSTGNFSIWLHVVSTPLKFVISIIDEDENIPFTVTENGPCMPALQYWQNETVGCPCNGNWVGGNYNDTGREIIPDQCPSSSCPEAFFINDTLKYGNVRMNVTVFQNGTILNKTLEITKMSPIKEIGYAFGAADVLYVFRSGKDENATPVPETNPEAPDLSPAEQNPTPYEMEPNPDRTENNSGSPLQFATTIATIFVFLLIMYENTQ